MATYGKKQGWQCHEILNQSERMSNSEKKGGGNTVMTELENNCLLIVQVSALIGPDPMLPTECNGICAGGRSLQLFFSLLITLFLDIF